MAESDCQCGLLATPLATAAGRVFGPRGVVLLSTGFLISAFGYLSGMMLAVPERASPLRAKEWSTLRRWVVVASVRYFIADHTRAAVDV